MRELRGAVVELDVSSHGNLPEGRRALFIGKPMSVVRYKGRFVSGATASETRKQDRWKTELNVITRISQADNTGS